MTRPTLLQATLRSTALAMVALVSLSAATEASTCLATCEGSHEGPITSGLYSGHYYRAFLPVVSEDACRHAAMLDCRAEAAHNSTACTAFRVSNPGYYRPGGYGPLIDFTLPCRRITASPEAIGLDE